MFGNIEQFYRYCDVLHVPVLGQSTGSATKFLIHVLITLSTNCNRLSGTQLSGGAGGHKARPTPSSDCSALSLDCSTPHNTLWGVCSVAQSPLTTNVRTNYAQARLNLMVSLPATPLAVQQSADKAPSGNTSEAGSARRHTGQQVPTQQSENAPCSTG